MAVVAFVGGWIASDFSSNDSNSDITVEPINLPTPTSTPVSIPPQDHAAGQMDLVESADNTVIVAPTDDPVASVSAESTAETIPNDMSELRIESNPLSKVLPEDNSTFEILIPNIQFNDETALTFAEALTVAELLAPNLTIPSDCGIPLGIPISLPNSPREYRSGIHQGVDFICRDTGRSALAALDGRIVMLVSDYIAPIPEDRSALLSVAQQIASTPPWTLAMLYGNFVVVDHGVISDVGHVITLYTHLDSIDPAIRVGKFVTAGTRLGEIGNLGTEAASTGYTNLNSLHLHWEIHVDNLYLGMGLDSQETDEVYRVLFGQ